VPAKHDEHWLEPDALYMFAGQATQEVAAADEYVFAGHGTGITAVLVSPEKLYTAATSALVKSLL